LPLLIGQLPLLSTARKHLKRYFFSWFFCPLATSHQCVLYCIVLIPLLYSGEVLKMFGMKLFSASLISECVCCYY